MGKKCRYCGDKWSPWHRCNSKKLYTWEAEKESNTSGSDSDKESKDEYDVPNIDPEEAMPNISLAVITRITQPKKLKLWGHIKKENVTILVDTRSTHNFIDINVATRLNLFLYPNAYIRVMVVLTLS